VPIDHDIAPIFTTVSAHEDMAIDGTRNGIPSTEDTTRSKWKMKAIDKTTGLSDFQIEYVQQYMTPNKGEIEKKGRPFVNFFLFMEFLVACGLWASIFRPEPSVLLMNFAHFGVVVLTLGFTFALLVTIAGVTIWSGSKVAVAGLHAMIETEADDPEEFKLRAAAANMMASRRSLAGHHPSSSWTAFRSGVTLTIHFWFFIGMVALGYILSPVVMAMTMGMVTVTNRLARNRLVTHIKTLTAERVLELEAAHQRATEEMDTEE
jgi:hypothetical protein